MAANRRLASQVVNIIVSNSLLVSHVGHCSSPSSRPLTHEQGESQTYHLTYDSPSRTKTHINSKTLAFLPSSAYNSSNHSHQIRSRREEGMEAPNSVQKTSTRMLAAGEGKSMERKEVKDVKETIRTGRLNDGLSSDKENIRHIEPRIVTKQSESRSGRRRVIKAPVFTFKESKKQKVCHAGTMNCNGQNSSSVRTNSMTSGVGRITYSNRNSDKAKQSRRTNKTNLLGKEVSNATNTKSPLKHLHIPESTWYEPIDRNDTDLMSGNNGTRSRHMPKLSEEQLRKLPLCPEIPPGLCKYSQAFSLTLFF